MYDAYSRFLLKKCFNKNYREDPSFTESDMIQDLTGMYCLETPLTNFSEKNDLINKIYDLIYKENNVVFISNDENGDELYQSFYQIIGLFELNDEYNEKINSLSTDKSNNFYFNNLNTSLNNNKKNNNSNIEGLEEFRHFNAFRFGEDREASGSKNNFNTLSHVKNNNFYNRNKNVLVKIRLINQNSVLQNDIRSQVLLDKNRPDLNKLLYQDKDNCCFTWLSNFNFF